jgi:hypothetical protein
MHISQNYFIYIIININNLTSLTNFASELDLAQT